MSTSKFHPNHPLRRQLLLSQDRTPPTMSGYDYTITSTAWAISSSNLSTTAICLVTTVCTAVVLSILTFIRPSLTLSPAHGQLSLGAYLAEWFRHCYHAFPSCVFKFNHWKTDFHPSTSLPEDVQDSVCVVTGVRGDGGIGFETCLALVKAGATRVYAGVHVRSLATPMEEEKYLNNVTLLMQKRLAEDGQKVSQTVFVPLPMDLTDFKNSYASAQLLKSRLFAFGDDYIDYFIGTVGMGYDRPSVDKSNPVLSCRYTENDDGVEYQTGINAVGTMVLLLALLRYFGIGQVSETSLPLSSSPLASPSLVPGSPTLSVPSATAQAAAMSRTSSGASTDSNRKTTVFSSCPKASNASARRRTKAPRIVLTSSIAHFWSTLPPFTVKPRYGSWENMQRDGSARTNAGRYSFSKLVQLHLLSTFADLVQNACRNCPATSPQMLAVHPGEVNTPFLAAFLPSWWLATTFGQWNNAFWCCSPFKGSWTGLYACVVKQASKTKYGYTYLTGLCAVREPSLPARDEGLIRDCWALFGPKLKEWFEQVGEHDVVAFLDGSI